MIKEREYLYECRHCGVAIRPCKCGASGGRTHWVDRGIDSRWCSQRRHFEAPLVQVQPHAPAIPTEDES